MKKAFIIILTAIALLGAAPIIVGLVLSQYFHTTFDLCMFDRLNKVYSVNVKPVFGTLYLLFFLLLCGMVIGLAVMRLVGACQKNVKINNVSKELLLPLCVGLLLFLMVYVGISYLLFGCIVDIG